MWTRIRGSWVGLGLGCVLLAGCRSDVVQPHEGADGPGVIAHGFRVPGAIAVIGDQEFLLAERSGTLHHFKDGGLTAIAGVPRSRMSDVWGGLLDVSLHPDFAVNRQVYLAYTDRDYGLAVARFTLRDGQAENAEVIHESDEFSIGSRIEWQDSDRFFLSHGIGGDPYPMVGSQVLDADVGKIHRLTADGGIPVDNPVLPGKSAPSTVWSYGHRNPQGLYFDSDEGRLFAVEHGPMGGDELNVVDAGGNYGWPLFSYGLNYDGSAVSTMTAVEASAVSTLPVAHWGPDFRVAPSGLLRIREDGTSNDDGSFLLGALNLQHLLRYEPTTDETTIVLRGVGRVRDVAALPDGGFLISVDAGSPTPAMTGRVIRLLPGARLPS